MNTLTKHDIERLFRLLNQALQKDGVRGEIYLVGGAVMCLVFEERPSTRDVDALFKPASKIREAAARVAATAGVDEAWLNDGVKGYLSDKGSFTPYLDLSHLRIFAAQPDYLLAMKCLAMRIGEQFHDLNDVRFLLRVLNVTSYAQALEIISRFYPLEKFPQKTLYALEEILSPAGGGAV